MKQKISVKQWFWALLALLWLLFGTVSIGQNTDWKREASPEGTYLQTGDSFIREIARIEKRSMPEFLAYGVKQNGRKLFLWLLAFLLMGMAWKYRLSSSFYGIQVKKKRRREACKIFERRGPPKETIQLKHA